MKDKETTCKAIDTDPLGFLISPMGLREFKVGNWEQQPCLRRGTPERAGFFSQLFDLQTLLAVAEQRQQANDPLKFGLDITAAKYVNGVRTTPIGKDTSVVELKSMYNKQGCTFQVHQPQRFGKAGECDGLWRLLSAMESQLGCLVGCNAYITPPKTQGLAPHHDDVEIFICQTQGAKRWKLYKPLSGFHLPNQSSPNLPVEGLGEPVLDTTLRVGDVLYMPRGTIHQAVASNDGSAHITLSTYQNWATGDFAMRALQVAGSGQHDAAPAGAVWPLAMRRSLPWGYLHHTSGLHEVSGTAGANSEDPQPGSGKGTSFATGGDGGSSGSASFARSAKHTAAAVAAGLRAFADQLEAKPHALVNQAANAAFTHFICRRLPPHPEQLHPKGPMPTMQDALVCRARNLFKVMPAPGQPEDCVITTPVHNNRLAHMCGPSHIVAVSADNAADGNDQEGGEHGGGSSSLHDTTPADDSDSSDSGSEGGEGGGGRESGSEEEEEVVVMGPGGEQRTLKAVTHSGASTGKYGSLAAASGTHGGNLEEGVGGASSTDGEEDEQGEREAGGEGTGSKEPHNRMGSSDEQGQEEGEEGAPGEDLQNFESVLPGPVAPAELAAVIEEVLGCHQPPGVRVRDIASRPHVRGKEEALELAVMLWREGFVNTVPASSNKLQPAKQLQQTHKKGHLGGILKGIQHSKQGAGQGKKKQRGGKAKRKGGPEGQPTLQAQKQKKQKKG